MKYDYHTFLWLGLLAENEFANNWIWVSIVFCHILFLKNVFLMQYHYHTFLLLGITAENEFANNGLRQMPLLLLRPGGAKRASCPYLIFVTFSAHWYLSFFLHRQNSEKDLWPIHDVCHFSSQGYTWYLLFFSTGKIAKRACGPYLIFVTFFLTGPYLLFVGFFSTGKHICLNFSPH